MKPKPIARMPLVSRARLDQLSRLGPWDREFGWAPTTPEDLRRVALAEASKPFWTNWDQEAIESIEEICRAFRLRTVGMDFLTFDPTRIRNHAAPDLSPDDREIYDHFIAWLDEMRHAGLKTYIPMVRDVIVLEESCREPGQFRRAVNLHIVVRRRA